MFFKKYRKELSLVGGLLLLGVGVYSITRTASPPATVTEEYTNGGCGCGK